MYEPNNNSSLLDLLSNNSNGSNRPRRRLIGQAGKRQMQGSRLKDLEHIYLNKNENNPKNYRKKSSVLGISGNFQVMGRIGGDLDESSQEL